MTRWIRNVIVAVLLVCLVGGAAIIVRNNIFGPTVLTADFASATGLYPGDEVRIAGVKVGIIRDIAPQPDYARVAMEVDHGIRIPADAKAVIVAQNLVAARYVQLAPLYRSGEPQLSDGAAIPLGRTAVPVEWDDVKAQLTKLATELGPSSDLSSTAVGKFIDSAASAMDGNGEKLRQTFSQLSQLARILADGSGDIVATIENLQTFVTALRDSGDELVVFQDRLATFGTVLADSRSDLDAAMKELAVAVSEVRRFIAGTRDKTAEQVQRLANVTQVLSDQHLDVENILHIAPTSFANLYNILHPNMPAAVGTFILNNASDPLGFLCGAIEGAGNVTAAESGKLCAQYLGPALNSMSLNYLPFTQNPFLQSSVTPDKLIYSDPALAPGGPGGPPGPPDLPPAVSAYIGAGDVAPPPGFVPLPPPVPGPADAALPAEAPSGAPAPHEQLPAEGTPAA